MSRSALVFAFASIGLVAGSGRYDRLHEIAFRDAFILDAVGSQQVSIVQ
jgi:hypothetical protein